MKTMLALRDLDREPHEIVVTRVLRCLIRSSCTCTKGDTARPEFDLAFTLDGPIYVREAGADDAVPWRSYAMDQLCSLEITETFRPTDDAPVRPREIVLARRRSNADALDYARRRREGLVDGYEADRPRDGELERAKRWRPAWKQRSFDGSEED